MYKSDVLLDQHQRSHRTLEMLLEHSRQFSAEEFSREVSIFGYPTLSQQFHHVIGAQLYWTSVLHGNIDMGRDEEDCRTLEVLDQYRREVFEFTTDYLTSATPDELNTPRDMKTWGGKVRKLKPADVFVRTMTHIFQHQGQIVTMFRVLGNPLSGTDYPLT